MTTQTTDYLRYRAQALFMIDLVELVASAATGGAALAAVQAAKMMRRVLEAAEAGADSYADAVEGLNAASALAARMKAEARGPTHVEWAALRAEIEQASERINR